MGGRSHLQPACREDSAEGLLTPRPCSMRRIGDTPPALVLYRTRVAQWLEQSVDNRQVVGSSPTVGTNLRGGERRWAA